MLVKPFAELFIHELLDVALDVAVQLALGLPLELRLWQPHADHRHQPFAHVIAGDADFVLLLLQHSCRGREVVDRTRQGGPKAGKVRSAIHGVDGVREREDVFAIAVVVLQRDFDFNVAAFPLHVNRRIVQRGFSPVQVLDEFRDAAGKLEFCGFLCALVGKGDFQALVQKGHLAQALSKRIEAIFNLIENRWIRMKRNFRPRLARLAGLLQLRSGLALFVGLLPYLAVTRNLQFQPIGKRIDHRNADAVEAARNFVRVAVEFSAGVQHGQDDFRRGALLRLVHIHGDAAAVVHHGDGVVRVHGNVDFIREAGQRFVDRVVHYFPDEMMQAHLSGRTDVHRGAQPHGFEPAENFDRFRVVLVAGLRGAAHVFFVAHVVSWRCDC